MLLFYACGTALCGNDYIKSDQVERDPKGTNVVADSFVDTNYSLISPLRIKPGPRRTNLPYEITFYKLGDRKVKESISNQEF